MSHAGLMQLLVEQLEVARRQGRTLTYRQLVDTLPLAVPRMQQLTACLERLAVKEMREGWPLRSALVVSQAGSGLPRQGFFQHLVEHGYLPSLPDAAGQQAWHAQELLRVFSFNYPGEDRCSGGNGGQN